MRYSPVTPLLWSLCAAASFAQDPAGDAPGLAPSQLIQIRPVVAEEPAPGGVRIDLKAERARLDAWLAEQDHRQQVRADASAIARFNMLPDERGGPLNRALRWYPRLVGRSPYNPRIWDFAYSSMAGSPAVALFGEEELRTGPQRISDTLVELFPIDISATHFTGADLDPAALLAQDEGGRGFPLLTYQMRAKRRKDYADWTLAMLNRPVAWIVRDSVRYASPVRTRITGPAQISGFTSLKEAQELIVALGGKIDAAATTTELTNYEKPDQVPAGTDPSDIAAMQSAQSMLAAEKRIRDMLKEGKLGNIDQILTFEEISSWIYEDGLKGMPKHLEQLDGKRVMMLGFMLPIDEVQNIKEFLLVQSLWSCCFGQPPDINGIVRVVMKDKRIDYLFEPIRVTGTFKIKAAFEDGYCVDIYQLEADSVEVIK